MENTFQKTPKNSDIEEDEEKDKKSNEEIEDMPF
jgi:hypothetical protein